jgi:predicted RecA/RadA family phage recombinase
MATNEAFGGNADRISLDVSANTGSGTAGAVLSGDPVVVGSLNGVALTDAGAEGNDADYATVALSGAYNLNVDGAVSNEGDPVYHDGTTTLTVVSTDGLFGHALETKTSGEGIIAVKIAPMVV